MSTPEEYPDSIDAYVQGRYAAARAAQDGPIAPEGELSSSWTTDGVPGARAITEAAARLVRGAFPELDDEAIADRLRDVQPRKLHDGVHATASDADDIHLSRLRRAAARLLAAERLEAAVAGDSLASKRAADDEQRRAAIGVTNPRFVAGKFDDQVKRPVSLDSWAKTQEADRQEALRRRNADFHAQIHRSRQNRPPGAM